MPDLKRVRKGTKSCTECRRRKVKCIWSSEEAPKCRRCEERGSNCVAQIYSVRSPNSRKLTSRDRIARLEQQVVTLSKALHSESGSNGLQFEIDEDAGAEIDGNSDSEGSSCISSDPGVFRNPPRHLQGLFENDLIGLNSTEEDTHGLHRERALAELSSAARRRLQELIPPKQEVEIIASYSSLWLSLFHALFPAPSMIKSAQDMISQYETVKSPEIDTAYLASWLMSIAMTIHQVPKGAMGPENQLKGFRNAAQFSKSVSDAVENTIMKYDSLLGTMQGIDCSMLFLRLSTSLFGFSPELTLITNPYSTLTALGCNRQLSRGNFKQTWLLLRRVIAVAELIGLHRAARQADLPTTVPENGNFWFDNMPQSNARKAQVWESLCFVDRITGMLFNLPPGTRRYRLPQHMHVLPDGKLSLRAYLSSLSEIAMKVQDLDDLEIPDNGNTDLYSQVLQIDSEMRVLTSITPAQWWHQPEHTSDHLLQYWHYYISIRVHLPFTLRHDTSEQFSFSRLACMKACQTLLSRYKMIRGTLPAGFFLCRIIDLQAFTALVVLILAYHAATSTEKSNLHAQGSPSPEKLVPQVLEFMKTILSDPISEYARQAVDAVSSLMQLLGRDGSSSLKKDLKLKVPLLGKLYIHRKQQHAVPSVPMLPSGSSISQAHVLQGISSMQSVGRSTTDTSSPFDMSNPAVEGLQDDYGWNPLSWSIEDDQAGVFQDALMMEDFTPFGPWWDQNSASLTTPFNHSSE